MKISTAKRLCALVLALAMALALAACGATATVPTAALNATPEAAAPAAPLVILHTNDVHGRDMISTATGETAIGDAVIAAEKRQYEDEGYNVLLLSAGDFAQGTTLVNINEGANAVKFMNETGYDAACPGNHEFDWGTDNALALAAACDFPVLAANVTRRADGSSLFDSTAVFEFDGAYKVGVFGLVTPQTATSANPAGIKDIEFAAGQELYDLAQQQVDGLKAAGCDLIICLGHLGVADDAAPNRSYDVIDNTTGIDIFIDGHSHTEITEQRGDTLLQSTGCYNAKLGFIAWDGGELSAQLLAPDELTAEPDPDVLADITAVDDALEAELGTVFAHTEVTLDGERDPGVRTSETNLGDLSADVIMWAAQQATGEKVDAAIENGGGIRATIPAGDITMNDIKTVFPFGNTVCTIKVTGAELLEMLEANCAYLPDSSGGFPQVAGMTLEIDTTVPYAQGEAYPDTTHYAPANPGSRVTITGIGGGEFDPEALYTIATNDFVASGGDASYAFRYAGETARVDTGLLLDECMVNYITEELGGVIGAQYAAAQGRIAIR